MAKLDETVGIYLRVDELGISIVAAI